MNCLEVIRGSISSCAVRGDIGDIGWADDRLTTHPRAADSKEHAALLREMKVRRFISDLNGYLTRAPCSVHVVGRNWDRGGVGPIAQWQRKSTAWYTLGKFEAPHMAQRSRRDWLRRSHSPRHPAPPWLPAPGCRGENHIGVMGSDGGIMNSRRWTV
jgi:hypothetical protein